MTVLYGMPAIGNQDNKQKGPTCWYYAAKMVARCHDTRWPLDHARWVSLVRKVSTFIDARGEKLGQLSEEGLSAACEAFMASKMNRDMVQLNPALSRTRFAALQPSMKWDFLPGFHIHSSSVPPLGKSLHPGLERALAMHPDLRQQDKPLPPEVQAALTLLEGKRFDGLSEVFAELTSQGNDQTINSYSSQIASSFIPAKKYGDQEINDIKSVFETWRTKGFSRGHLLTKLGFTEVDKAKTLEIAQSLEALDEFMRTHGPLWCGATLMADVQAVIDSFKSSDPKRIHNLTSRVGWVAYKSTLIHPQGLATHAIALCGVSTHKDKRCIYYRDPNLSERVLFSDFAPFKSSFEQHIKDPSVCLMYYEKNRAPGTTCQRVTA